MNYSISEFLSTLSARALKTGGLLALFLIASFTVAEPARAQTSDTWKSVAIIGGTTAAGAYIGHKVAGRTGAYMGAAAGAATGYAIDRRRRQNRYNNGYYGNNGYYDPNGYYPDNAPYYPNGGYPNGGYGNYPYGSGYQSNYYSNSRR